MPPIVHRESLSACLEQYSGEIADPRVERTRALQLLDIIAIGWFAVLAGADRWVAIETYGNSKRACLETFLALPNGIPSHGTFARVFARKDHAPRNFSLLRRFALNLLHQDSSKGRLPMKHYRAGLDDQFMRQILTPPLAPDEA